MTAQPEVKSFQGTSFAECRGKWSQWCDEQKSGLEQDWGECTGCHYDEGDD